MPSDSKKRESFCLSGAVPQLEPPRIDGGHWRIAGESVKIYSAFFLDRVSIWPPLKVRIIEPVTVMIEAGVDVVIFGAKSVSVGFGEGASFGESISKGIVTILRYDDLLTVN